MLRGADAHTRTVHKKGGISWRIGGAQLTIRTVQVQ
jgi:hypothetical protein